MIVNLTIFIIMASIPLFAEYSTASPGNVPGTGFQALIYEPFSFAYPIFTALLFISFNIYVCFKKSRPVWSGALFGIAWSLVWFCMSFLALTELHLYLGGTL